MVLDSCASINLGMEENIEFWAAGHIQRYKSVGRYIELGETNNMTVQIIQLSFCTQIQM